jgi:DNA-binding transcriptional LysR family regulator
MIRDELSVLSAFVTVAEERSFTRAAKRLGVTQSALSHAIKGLEDHIGVRLLARTTRSVAPTDAGTDLLTHLRPALSDVRGAIDRLGRLRDKPAGRVRIVAPRMAAISVLAPKLGQFVREFPDISLDIVTNDGPVDLVAGGFDAGIQFGEFIQKDMVAVRVSPDHRPAIVGSVDYFKAHPKPVSPRDLLQHRCINFRHGASGVYRWEFDKGRRSLAVAVSGPLVVDEVEILIRATVDGAGLAFLSEVHAAPFLASGSLVRVLEDWCPPFPGYFLYYPSRRQQPTALAALIGKLRI